MCVSNGIFVILCVFSFVPIARTQNEVCASSGDEDPNYCLLRENFYDKRLWNYYSGFNCYSYTNDARLIKRYKFTGGIVQCDGVNKSIPLAVISDSIHVTFNYKIESDLNYIRRSFKNDAVFENYITCCRESETCCNDAMNNINIFPTDKLCPAVWDAWSCFPPTPVNSTARLPCSSQAYQSPDDVCTLESEKRCIWNSSTHLSEWIQQTDYSTCAIAPVYTRRYNFHIIFLGICIGFCVPAICIFFKFEKLRKTIRVILHRNLLIAICIRNVFTILSKKLVILDQLKPTSESFHRMDDNGTGCRILAFLEQSSVNCIYACMFLDAYYLHKVIVRAFAKETRMVHVYIVLFAMTFTFSVSWAIVMGAKEAQNCWMVDIDNLQWILDGFRICILVVNTILLADILRVMILKLKHGSTTKQSMAAFRATIFLIPLFGLHIIVTAKKIVYDNSCKAEDIYNYARYSMEGLQGIVVSILFCYANSEVQNEVRNAYRKTCIYLNQRYGWNIGGDILYDKRRATTATFIQETNQ